MAKKYPPQYLWQLLKICSWKSKSSFDFTGFSTLAENINNERVIQNVKADFPEISQKYLNDLLLELNEKLDNGENIGRNSPYIESILKYIDYSSWESFEKIMIQFENQIDTSGFDLEDYPETTILVLTTKEWKSKLEKQLEFPNKVMHTNLSFSDGITNDFETTVNTIQLLKKESPFIIWGIDDTTDVLEGTDPLKSKLNDLIKDKNILPIRLSNGIETNYLPSKVLNKKAVPSGGMGLLTALSFFELTQKLGNSSIKKSTALFGGRLTIENINNSGTINTGEVKQENHGGNNAGGNIIQHFYSKGDK